MIIEWLYPELNSVNPKDRITVLQNAKDGSFDAIELIGTGIALIFVVVLTRYSVTEMGMLGRIGAALANFVIALPLLFVFAGPFYVRRVRRGLRDYIQRNSQPTANHSE